MGRALLVERKDEFGFGPKQIVEKLTSESNPLFSRYRLAIMLEVYASGATEFVQLRHDLRIDDGALKTHLKVLQSEGWITGRREPRLPGGRRMHTMYAITQKGLEGIEAFFNELNDINKAFILKGMVDAKES